MGGGRVRPRRAEGLRRKRCFWGRMDRSGPELRGCWQPPRLFVRPSFTHWSRSVCQLPAALTVVPLSSGLELRCVGVWSLSRAAMAPAGPLPLLPPPPHPPSVCRLLVKAANEERPHAGGTGERRGRNVASAGTASIRGELPSPPSPVWWPLSTTTWCAVAALHYPEFNATFDQQALVPPGQSPQLRLAHQPEQKRSQRSGCRGQPKPFHPSTSVTLSPDTVSFLSTCQDFPL